MIYDVPIKVFAEGFLYFLYGAINCDFILIILIRNFVCVLDCNEPIGGMDFSSFSESRKVVFKLYFFTVSLCVRGTILLLTIILCIPAFSHFFQ